MVRQTHSYLAGAISSTMLIAIAVLAFVVLVSAQAFRGWPVSGLGPTGDRARLGLPKSGSWGWVSGIQCGTRREGHRRGGRPPLTGWR